MKTTILGHEVEYSWEGEGEDEIDDSDINHIKECIEEGNNQGELCQIDKENGEVESAGWWEINDCKEDKKTMGDLEKTVGKIDKCLERIYTLKPEWRRGKEFDWDKCDLDYQQEKDELANE